MKRPKVTSYSLASPDGRLTLAPDVLLLYGDPRWSAVAGDSAGVYTWLQETFRPQAFLEGSGSFVLPGQPGDPLPPVSGDPEPLYLDFLPEEVVSVPGRRWLAVVDSGGRVRWVYKEFPGEEWAGWHILVLASRDTPPEYLAYLQRERIPYLVAGKERVDLPAALDKLAGLGVSRLVSTAGGRLNGALLRQGLIDEITVEFFPAVIGGTHTPSLFDSPDLRPDELPTRLDLLDCQALPGGRVRLSYAVSQKA